ncbi:MAG: hypothetical protein Q9163_003893, partial [Psora crenata]
ESEKCHGEERKDKREMPSQPLVESLNALPLSEYRSRLCDPVMHTEISYEDRGAATPLTVSLESPRTVSPGDFEACFDLVATTSSEDYATSSMGWSPAKKKREMRLPDMRYLLLKKKPLGPVEEEQYPDRAVVGFLSFMLTYEDGYEVVYCYEIHLAPELRAKGIGERLMCIFETIGVKAGVQKAMLTVLAVNDAARRFYERIGYEEDDFSPTARTLRGGIVKKPDYAILSKALTMTIGSPDHISDKKSMTG